MAEPAIDLDIPAGVPYLTDDAERRRRNGVFVRMVRDWLDDETGFDESTWPVLRSALDRERTIAGESLLFQD